MALLYFDGFKTYQDAREIHGLWKTIDDRSPVNDSEVKSKNFYGEAETVYRIESTNEDGIEGKLIQTTDNDFFLGFGLVLNEAKARNPTNRGKQDPTVNYRSFLHVYSPRGDLVMGLGINPFSKNLMIIKSTNSTDTSNVVVSSTPANTITPNTYYYIEFSGSVSSNATSVLRIDGETVMTVTGIDTVVNNSFPKTVQSIGFRTANIDYINSNFSYEITNFYICDSTGTKYNNFIGPIFTRKMEIAEVKNNEWQIQNENTVVSALSKVDRSSYITTNTPASAAVRFSANSVNVSTTKAIKTFYKIRKGISVPASAKYTISVSGNASTVEKSIDLQTSYINNYDIYENRPDSTDWTVDDLNNLIVTFKKP